MKNFFETILEGSGLNAPWYDDVVAKEARNKMKTKEGLVMAVSEYSDSFVSIIGTKCSFTMDQWLHSVLTWRSTFVLGSKSDGLLHADVYDACVVA